MNTSNKSNKKNFQFVQNKKCEYFPCHKNININNFNCLFCYCPLYLYNHHCGGNFTYYKGIKDCSKCVIPHCKKKFNWILKKFNMLNKNFNTQKPILFATSNLHKKKEIINICNNLNITLPFIFINNITNFMEWTLPTENGKNFQENALIKAKYYANLSNLPTLAEDSGLIINKLNNFPGIYSNRWLNNKSYRYKILELLKLLKAKNISDTSCKYFATMCYYNPYTKEIVYFNGKWEGKLVKPKSIKNGFGYDIGFYDNNLKKIVTNFSDDEKAKISHRSIALRNFIFTQNKIS